MFSKKFLYGSYVNWVLTGSSNVRNGWVTSQRRGEIQEEVGIFLCIILTTMESFIIIVTYNHNYSAILPRLCKNILLSFDPFDHCSDLS